MQSHDRATRAASFILATPSIRTWLQLLDSYLQLRLLLVDSLHFFLHFSGLPIAHCPKDIWENTCRRQRLGILGNWKTVRNDCPQRNWLCTFQKRPQSLSELWLGPFSLLPLYWVTLLTHFLSSWYFWYPISCCSIRSACSLWNRYNPLEKWGITHHLILFCNYRWLPLLRSEELLLDWELRPLSSLSWFADGTFQHSLERHHSLQWPQFFTNNGKSRHFD